MNRPIAATVVALLLAATGAGAAERLDAIPDRFLGEWRAVSNACADPAGETWMRISSDRIAFYESEGPVIAVVADGKETLTVTIELSGEGEVWELSRRFRLSEDQKILSDISEDSDGFDRHRCPPVTR
ncbi:MAG: hypothetical protein HC834_10260 [Rhodospirillales bacterium]|nr:hypothetical protein [Rhodospirillales bacterium]